MALRYCLLNQFATKGNATGARWSVLNMNSPFHACETLCYRDGDSQYLGGKGFSDWRMGMKDRDEDR